MNYAITPENVKLIGRTFFLDEVCWCGPSGSGIAFTCEADHITIRLIGDDTTAGNITEGPARVGIYVNGKRVIDTIVTEAVQEHSIFESEQMEPVIVEVRKLSECAMSVAGIGSIEANTWDGIHPLPDKPFKIEFIGDSITCGFGIDREDPDTLFETATEDFTRTYAYKTAAKLCADYSAVAFSGFGIVSGYTDNGEKNTLGTIPPFYDKVGFSFGHPKQTVKLEEITWDSTQFRPNAVVLNLGTNDTSYCGTDVQRQQEFVGKYVDFLETIRRKNPDAFILCVLGTMGTVLCSAMEQSVKQYSRETGDARIHALPLPEQSPEDGLVTGNHPTERTHEKVSEMLVEALRPILDATGSGNALL